MPYVPVLTTSRLLLRGFTDGDREPFARMNADPRVTAQLLGPLTRTQSDALVDRITAHWEEHGWGLWALERRDTGAFVGYTGLWPVRFEHPLGRVPEVGWRLAAEHWGHGFATEAGRRALAYAFDNLGWAEVVSLTARTNVRSEAVMRRIGLRQVPGGDFDHPLVPAGHPLRPHVLYRLTAAEWKRVHSSTGATTGEAGWRGD